MKKLLLLAVLLVLSSPASAATPRAVPAPYAGVCGLPSTQPVWFEFGQTYLQPVFGRPGIVVGASTGAWPEQMRALGAGTVYFDLNLKNRVGTPTKPTVVAKLIMIPMRFGGMPIDVRSATASR